MKKIPFAFLAVVCALTLIVPASAAAETARDSALRAAFERGTLTLKELPFLAESEPYTVRVPASREDVKLPLTDAAAAPAFTADGGWLTCALSGADIALQPYYFSPDGGKAICVGEEALYLVEGHTVTAILPGFEHSVPDIYESFQKFSQKSPDVWIGMEGPAWSPDGRYAAITNWAAAIQGTYLIYGLHVVDTRTGELLCLDTYPHTLTENHGTVIQACFDGTGRYLYYMVIGNDDEDGYFVHLMRYDMETGERRGLLGSDFNIARPKLQTDSHGQLWTLTNHMQNDLYAGLNLYRLRGDAWEWTAYPFPQPQSAVYPLYMEIGGKDLGVSLVRLNPSSAPAMQLPLLFRVLENGVDYRGLLLVKGFDAAQAELMPLDAFRGRADSAEALRDDALQCLNVKLSPDGGFALILAERNGETGLLLMDMETLALRRVNADTDSTALHAALYSGPISGYQAGLNWVSGNRLVMNTQDGLRLYALSGE